MEENVVEIGSLEWTNQASDYVFKISQRAQTREGIKKAKEKDKKVKQEKRSDD